MLKDKLHGAAPLLDLGAAIGIGLFAPPEHALNQAFVAAVFISLVDHWLNLGLYRLMTAVSPFPGRTQALLLMAYCMHLGAIVTVAQVIKTAVF